MNARDFLWGFIACYALTATLCFYAWSSAGFSLGMSARGGLAYPAAILGVAHGIRDARIVGHR